MDSGSGLDCAVLRGNTGGCYRWKSFTSATDEIKTEIGQEMREFFFFFFF